ncbi:MAG TPA: hypothetical protein VH813_08960 [Candidatus Limnocylindrales bacterium]|jgi:hypothetical protein
MADVDGSGDRSERACPACGAHRLAVLSFPDLPGSRPTDLEIPLGGRAADPAAPAIGCLACGAEWRDLDAFSRATAAATDEDPPG